MNYTSTSVQAYREPQIIRFFAHLFSIIFHPLFLPCYVAAFLIFVHPFIFAGFTDKLKLFRFVSIFISMTFLPAFSVFLLWRLQFIKSLKADTRNERIFIYVISMIFYFWVWYVFKKLEDSPIAMKQFLLGAFLAICSAWLINIFMKVSMHTTAIGAIAAFFLTLALNDAVFSGIYLVSVIFIAGIVTTSRLVISSHSPKEIYWGLAAGAVSQLAAFLFI